MSHECTPCPRASHRRARAGCLRHVDRVPAAPGARHTRRGPGAAGPRASRQCRDRARTAQGRRHAHHAEEGRRRLERRRAWLAGRCGQGTQAPPRSRRAQHRRGKDPLAGKLPAARRAGRRLSQGQRDAHRGGHTRANLGAHPRQILERQVRIRARRQRLTDSARGAVTHRGCRPEGMARPCADRCGARARASGRGKTARGSGVQRRARAQGADRLHGDPAP